jgi:hypothetical protein
VLESRPTEPVGPGVNHELVGAQKMGDGWSVSLAAGGLFV